MNTPRLLLNAVWITLIVTSLTSCFSNEDPGPLQEQEKEYSITDFDRLDASDALDLDVRQGSGFSIVVKGDRRNLDDLEVIRTGSTLRMRYIRGANRRHETKVTITMPTLEGVAFSGAVTADISGFTSDDDFEMTLSGASDADLRMTAGAMRINLSGASELEVYGVAPVLSAVVSGASDFRAFNLQAEEATVEASGASSIRVSASKKLVAKASGASDIRYRGNPQLNSSSSGASTIGAD